VISSEPARRTIYRTRIRWFRVACVLAAVAAMGAIVGRQPHRSTPSTARAPEHVREPRRVLGEADGAVPDRTTVFDGAVPGVARLDPALLGAVRQAATAAANDGVAFVVDSGWRSAAYQERLLLEAVSKYGSQAEAARWVAPPSRSAHVSGDAVDMASGAAAWLAEHGYAYGLCRIYDNEPWHYELRPEAVGQGCPAMYPDPTHDPRMQR
jgi:hypothetical protein